MSLLIKALEQAAKDREAAAKAEGAPRAEPLVSNRNVTSFPEPGAQRRTATSLSDLAQVEAQQRARAASVVQAGESGGSKVIGYLRTSPIAMIGAVAVVIGIVFGIYVYLQVANPGLLARQPPPPSTPAPSAPAPAVAGSGSASSAAAQPAPATASRTAPAAITALPDQPAAGSAGAISSPTVGVPAKAGVLPPALGTGIPTESVVASPGAAPPTPATPPSLRAATPQRELAPEARAAEATPASERVARAPATPAPASPARERIVVSSGTPKPTINPQLGPAYAALQAGDIEQARSLYQRVADAEALNIDALLGLAFIAVQENRTDDAMRQYLRILQLEPRNPTAQAGMIALAGRADPGAAETRLKQLISREPSPFLHFILGNLYADQGAWPQAQQSFFQAHALEPDNADYAYNLAISLDHLRQSKLALNYYRRADQLAGARGRANFNLAQARERIRSLSAQVE